MKTILVTGTCGFIFSNFIRKLTADQSDKYRFVSVDKIVQSYNLKNIYEHKNHKFYMGDIADADFMDNVFKLEQPHYVINGAAESFVDHAIASAIPFVHSNVFGTQVMIDTSVKYGVERFLQISTDEVYGQLKNTEDESWTENSPLAPRNPYSASKGAAELLVKAAVETHKLPGLITRCCNNFGPRQPPRNLIPKIITSLINKQIIPIHGNGKNIREWLYVTDHNEAVMTVLEKGKVGEIYNIGSGMEKSNISMVNQIATLMQIDPEITNITDRKGHDFRYSVNFDKIKALGWAPKFNFETSLEQTIRWYVDNQNFYDTKYESI